MKIIISNLLCHTIIGVHDWERATKRPLEINLEIKLHNEKAGASDNLSDTLDYESLANELTALIGPRVYNLIEKVAHDISDCVLAKNAVASVIIEVIKPAAIKQSTSVSVVLEKSNGRNL